MSPPDGKLNGPAPKRNDVPDGATLLAEWEAGQLVEPNITYHDLATKYQCSSSLIHKRIQQVVKNPEPPADDTEIRILNNLLEGFKQLRENCGHDAVQRVLTYITKYMEDNRAAH